MLQCCQLRCCNTAIVGLVLCSDNLPSRSDRRLADSNQLSDLAKARPTHTPTVWLSNRDRLSCRPTLEPRNIRTNPLSNPASSHQTVRPTVRPSAPCQPTDRVAAVEMSEMCLRSTHFPLSDSQIFVQEGGGWTPSDEVVTYSRNSKMPMITIILDSN